MLPGLPKSWQLKIYLVPYMLSKAPSLCGFGHLRLNIMRNTWCSVRYSQNSLISLRKLSSMIASHSCPLLNAYGSYTFQLTSILSVTQNRNFCVHLDMMESGKAINTFLNLSKDADYLVNLFWDLSSFHYAENMYGQRLRS